MLHFSCRSSNIINCRQINEILDFSGRVRVDLSQFVGKAFMLRPFSSGQLFLHQRKNEVWADKFDGTHQFLKDASFVIVGGLTGHGVSFRSATNPKLYIRHQNYKLYVMGNDNSALFKKDATFNVRYGLGASNGRFGISFESVNFPGYFISLNGARGQIMKMANTGAFKMASTFMPVVAQVKVTHKTTTSKYRLNQKVKLHIGDLTLKGNSNS